MLFHFGVSKPVATAIMEGNRTFDIRESSHEIQPGDEVHYFCGEKGHSIESKIFVVTYVACSEGIMPGWVVLGIEDK